MTDTWTARRRRWTAFGIGTAMLTLLVAGLFLGFAMLAIQFDVDPSKTHHLFPDAPPTASNQVRDRYAEAFDVLLLTPVTAAILLPIMAATIARVRRASWEERMRAVGASLLAVVLVDMIVFALLYPFKVR